MFGQRRIFLEQYLSLKLKIQSRNCGREKPRFLVIEDDQSLLDSLLLALEERGFAAAGLIGPEGLPQLFSRFRPNLWLVDYFLSQHRIGADLSSGRPGNSAFILMSAYPQARLVAERLGLDFLEKPFPLDRLVSQAYIALRRQAG